MAGLEQLKNRLKSSLDKALIGVIAAVLLVVMVAFAYEQTASVGDVPDIPNGSINISITMDPKNEEGETSLFQAAMDLGLGWPSIQNEGSEYRYLTDFNMFDAKEVVDARRLEELAQGDVRQARQAFEQGRYARAREFVDRALQRRLAFPPALDILRKIEEAENQSRESQNEEGTVASVSDAVATQ